MDSKELNYLLGKHKLSGKETVKVLRAFYQLILNGQISVVGVDRAIKKANAKHFWQSKKIDVDTEIEKFNQEIQQAQMQNQIKQPTVVPEVPKKEIMIKKNGVNVPPITPRSTNPPEGQGVKK